MANENIFDLTKLAPDNKQPIKKIKPMIDKESLLEDYQLVDKANWEKIPYKSHIRYQRTDGEFRKGGYVTKIEHVKDQDGNPTIKIDMISNFSATAIKWSVYIGNIQYIWIKKQDESQHSQPQSHNIDMSELQEDIKYCKQSIDQMRQKIQQMENETARVLTLIKKLHNLK